MKKPGHQWWGESRVAERGNSHRKQLLQWGLKQPWTPAEKRKKNQPNPATPLEDSTETKHYHSSGSSFRATVPKLGKRTVFKGTSTLHFFMWKSLDFYNSYLKVSCSCRMLNKGNGPSLQGVPKEITCFKTKMFVSTIKLPAVYKHIFQTAALFGAGGTQRQSYCCSGNKS